MSPITSFTVELAPSQAPLQQVTLESLAEPCGNFKIFNLIFSYNEPAIKIKVLNGFFHFLSVREMDGMERESGTNTEGDSCYNLKPIFFCTFFI